MPLLRAPRFSETKPEPSPVGEGGSRRLTDEVFMTLSTLAWLMPLRPCHYYAHPAQARLNPSLLQWEKVAAAG